MDDAKETALRMTETVSDIGKKKTSRKRRTPVKKEIVVLDSKTNNNYLVASLIGANLVAFVLMALNLFG